MSQPPKIIIHIAKRKINANEQIIQDLIARITQYKRDEEKAIGSTEDEEEALSDAIKKYSATAKTNTAALEVLRQAESKAAAEMRKLEQELARATEKSKAATEKREDFEDAHQIQMNIYDDNVEALQRIAEQQGPTENISSKT